MVQPQAAVIVLPHKPDRDELAELAEFHLDEFPAAEAYATFEFMEQAPDWLELHEQDQMNAFMRDLNGGCILVIYMKEGEYPDDDTDMDVFDV